MKMRKILLLVLIIANNNEITIKYDKVYQSDNIKVSEIPILLDQI